MTTLDTPTRHPQAPAERAGATDRPRRGHLDRLALAALLVGTAVLYLIGLGGSGNANDFYAAAVQAGTKSWKAFFFGSFDSSNFITVDKPPLSLWPMEISGRIFGFNSWSMLAPQAVEGVLAVWLLYATVRRWFGTRAGLLAGALLAITPVAVLMFRFNNPDAMMVLLMVAAAYCVTRAIEGASTRWLLITGLVMGLSFLAKGLQPFTALPALAIAYLVAAPTPWPRRIWQLLLSGVAVVVGAGWWVLAVQLTPAADRPYIGGSGDNTALGLAFGYNGISRLSGGSGGGGGAGGGGGGGFDGSTGIARLFNSLNGGQIAWLLPTALIAIVALAVTTARAPLADRTRAALIVWGGWLVVTGLLLSFADGIIHTYYTVELAPAIAALTAIGAAVLWRRRDLVGARVGLAAGVLAAGITTEVLFRRSSSFHPWVGWVALGAAVVAAVLVLAPPAALRRGLLAVAIVTGLLALGSGPAAYAVETAATAHTGSTPTAGPTVSGGGFGGAFGGMRGGGTRPGGARGGFPGGASGTRPSFPGGTSGTRPSSPGGTSGTRPSFPGGTSGTKTRGAGGGGNGFGGATTADSALVALLEKTSSTWAAATVGSQSAAPLELASGKAVMAIGGFSGTDAAPTLAQFEAYVKAGKIHYFIGGSSGRGGPGGGGTGSAIAAWVSKHYTATTVGGSTVYDLTKATSS